MYTHLILQSISLPPTLNITTNIFVEVDLFVADISRTGRYILCVNLEGPHFRCGESVDITITGIQYYMYVVMVKKEL